MVVEFAEILHDLELKRAAALQPSERPAVVVAVEEAADLDVAVRDDDGVEAPYTPALAGALVADALQQRVRLQPPQPSVVRPAAIDPHDVHQQDGRLRSDLVGLLFDGNEGSMASDWSYNEKTGRSIATDIRFALFVAREVHGAGWIVDELTN